MNKEVLLALLYQRFPILFGPLKSSNFYLPRCCWCPDQPMQSCDGENANKRFRVYDFALFGSWLSAKCPHWGLWEQICNSDLWLGIILEWRFLDVGVVYSGQNRCCGSCLKCISAQNTPKRLPLFISLPNALKSTYAQCVYIVQMLIQKFPLQTSPRFVANIYCWFITNNKWGFIAYNSTIIVLWIHRSRKGTYMKWIANCCCTDSE